MRYAAKLLIPSRRLAVINGYLNAEQEDEFQGEDNTIIHTVLFPDGKFMDIKCCGCQDESSWTEAVLFAKANGGGFSQVAYTEPDESYLGEWELEDEGNSYFVEVVDGGDIENLELAIISPEGVISRDWQAEGWSISFCFVGLFPSYAQMLVPILPDGSSAWERDSFSAEKYGGEFLFCQIAAQPCPLPARL